MENQEMNEVLKTFNLNADELAYQLTAYEKGFIDYEDGIRDLIVKPYLDDLSDDELVGEFNEYCQNNNCYDDEIHEFNDYFFEVNFSSPIEAARAVFFGDIKNWMDEYIKFNTYGNLESLKAYDVRQEILDNTDFVNWLYETKEDFEDLRDEDFKDSIIDMIIRLVKQGY